MSGKRLRKKLLSLGLLLIIIGLSYIVKQNPQIPQPVVSVTGWGYAVTEFIDGDTIAVDMDGKTEKVRMIGVDTPETKDPRTTVQCFGEAASKYTHELIGTSRVRLEADPLNTNRDRYDRLLRYIYLPDGRLVNAEIIKEGYGFAYLNFPFSKSEDFHSYETTAREASKGLWGSCQTTDQNGRQQSAPAL